MGNILETEGEDKQQSDNVMQKVSTPVKYPVPSQKPSIQSDDASDASLSMSHTRQFKQSAIVVKYFLTCFITLL